MEGEDEVRNQHVNVVCTINSHYAAVASAHGISITPFHSPNGDTYLLRYDGTGLHSVLAFSPTRLNVIAAAHGPQVLILDVEARGLLLSIKGNGRFVTAIVFAEREPEIFATGAVDGSITIWSLNDASTPLHRLRGACAAPTRVAFHPRNAQLLSACYQERIFIWSLPSARPVAVLSLPTADIELLQWCNSNEASVLTVTAGGLITIFDVDHALSQHTSFSKARPHDQSDSEDETDMFGGMDGFSDDAATPLTFRLSFPVSQACLLGQRGLVVLPQHAKVLYFYAYSRDNNELIELWRIHKNAVVDCFAIQSTSRTVVVITKFGERSQTYDVPATVLDGLGWPTEGQQQWLPVLSDKSPEKFTSVHPMMLPERLFRRDSFDVETGGRVDKTESPPPRPMRNRESRSDIRSTKRDKISLPSMTSSLELPQVFNSGDDDEDDSPMPFLSPAIPARRVSPRPLSPLDMTMKLPPRASFDSITSRATYDYESDSDDGTFAEHMQGSGSFLPGGVNVPLPRTCGATFGPNGQLLTFLRYTKKTVPFTLETEPDGSRIEKSQSTEATRLFPGFGNLSAPRMERHADDNNDVASIDSLPDALGNIPTLALQTASFDSRLSWTAKVSPVKQISAELPGQDKVNITVRDLGDVMPMRQKLAGRYRLLSKEAESDTRLCTHNADLAAAEGLHGSANAWHLLGLILEHRSMSASTWSHSGELLLAFPNMTGAFTLSDSGMLQGTNHPFGKSWAIEKLFTWAEGHANVQMLACMSALVLRASSIAEKRGLMRLSVKVQPQTLLDPAYGRMAAVQDMSRIPPLIPILRTASGHRSLGDSPVKTYASQPPSRDPSLPTSPYFESSSGTPPILYPTPSTQHSTKLSNSASPEHYRSSFGMAARNYAASIAEKFSYHGSSPPRKKSSVSPNNGLSSSLPTQPGSWSKSVSFASTIYSSKASQPGSSLAQEDDEYDSDRTIDDTSLPHTPKTSGGVSFVIKQGGLFNEMRCGFPPAKPLLSEPLAAKCRIWRRYYAELLRSWNLFLEAAELENISDVSVDETSQISRSGSPFPDIVIPQSAGGKDHRATCNICFCVIRAAEQICPACFHTTHPACLEDLLFNLGDETFACPSGCGCNCTSADQVSWILDDEVSVVPTDTASLPHLRPETLSATESLRLQRKLHERGHSR